MSGALRFILPIAAVAVLGMLLFTRACDSEGPALRDAPEPRARQADPDLLATGGRAGSSPFAPVPALAPGKPGPDTRKGPVRVTVLGPGDVPIPGVEVLVTDGTVFPPGSEGVTDANGRALLGQDLPYDGSLWLQFHAPEPWRKAGTFIPSDFKHRTRPTDQLRIRGPELVFHARTGMHVDVRVVGAETGGEIEGVKLKCRKALSNEGRDWAEAPRRFLMTPAVASRTVLHWGVEPPRGWVQWDRAWVQTTISPYARELEFVYPLRREMAVTVTPLESEGMPADGRIHRVRVAGRAPGKWHVDGDAYGRLHLHGIPFLRDEILDIGVCRKDLTGPAHVRAVIPDHPATPIDLQVTLPEEGRLGDGSNESIGLGGRSGSAFRDGRQASRPGSRVLVTVRRRDGKPAIGAAVKILNLTRTTDAQGKARFENLPARALDVTVRQEGLLPIKQQVLVPSAGGEIDVMLREGRGGSVALVVVDDAGVPLPYAVFSVTTASGLAWIDMPKTRQRIDPFTDHLGRRVLRHVEPGFVAIEVTWGSRSKVAKFRVAEGETLPVRAVLRRPTPR